jgi:hypothetical protein
MALREPLDDSTGPLRGLLVLDFGQAAVWTDCGRMAGYAGSHCNQGGSTQRRFRPLGHPPD